MLFILNKSHEVVGSLNSNGDLSRITTYFDDKYVQDLGTGAETFEFSTVANTEQAQHLVAGNFVAFKDDGEFKLFHIIQIEETHDDIFIKTCYCEMAGIELINEIIRPMKVLNSSLRKFLTTILEGTEWQLGRLDAGFTQVHDFEVTDYKSVYELIQEHAVGTYGAEISYRVEIEHGRIVGKYIDCYAQRGNNNGFRFAYGSNLTSVTKTVDTSNLATALIGVGKNGITFKEVDTPDKPLNSDFIANETAYKQWNINGSHIFGVHKEDTDSPQELLRLTRLALEERSNPQIKYEMKVELLGREVKIGDTVNIVDHEFNPPLYLSARVNQLKRSKANPYDDEVVLANFKELNSNITSEMRNLATQLEGYVDSQFPIGGDKIQNGAIGKEQFSKQYHTEIVADAVYASLVETEELIAGKADIGDLTAINAKIENLKVEKADITELHAQKAEIEELVATKADIGQLNATNAQIENLKANKADISDLHATNVTIGELQANKADIGELNVVKGEINHLKSEVAEIGVIKGDVADIEHILAGNITSDNIAAGAVTADKIQTGAITAGSGIIADGAIGSAQISTVDAGKISAGKIDTSKVEVAGTDGHLRIKGNRLQVFNGVGNQAKERVSIGDVNGDGSIYGLRVRGADGQTVLLDENGVKSEGITDGSITNNKISDDANIDGAKLNINSVVSKINEDGTEVIKGTKIEVEGTSLTTKLSTITNKQTEQGEKITQNSSSIKANQDAIKLKVDSQTYQTDKTNMTSKLEKNTSDINVMKGEIALKVEQTDIANAINNIEVGNRNLLLDTSTVKTITGNNKENQCTHIYYFKDRSKHNLKKATVSTRFKYSVSEGASGTFRLQTNGSANSSLGETGGYWLTLSPNTNVATNPNKVVTNIITINCPNEKGFDGVQVRMDNFTGTLKIEEVIIVEGNTTITDWAPAPEDINNNIDTKINSAKSEIKVTTDAISQNVSNLSQTVSTKADGSTVTSINNKVSSLETSVNGISGKVSSLEKTTTTLGGQVSNAQNTADSAVSKANSAQNTANTANNTANSNKTNITNLQGEVSTVKSNIASLEVTTSGISQKVSSVESTTSTLTSKVNTVESTANQAKTSAESANNKVDNMSIGGRNLAQSTSSSYSSAFNSFTGTTNTCPSLAKVLTDGLSVGDTVTVKLIYKYKDIVATSGQTASCWIQGSGDVTSWNSGAFAGSPRKTLTGSGEHTFLYSFKITDNHLKNTCWNTNIRHDYVQSGSVQWKMFKVEKGNKATDWTPAPEDVNGAINSVDGKVATLQGTVNTTNSKVATLETNLNGITQRVSSTESTTATLTSKVNTVESTANQAKTDASSANSNATNALNKANSANTLADSKAKVFTTTPTTPYKVGDLWVQGTSGDVMRCKTARSSGSYNSADWEKASKYTDDTKANAVDGKVTNLQTEYNKTKSQVAEIVTDLNGITQRVSSTESTTATLTTQVTNAQNSANSANSKIDNLEIGGRNYALGTQAFISKTGENKENQSVNLYSLNKEFAGNTVTTSFDWEVTGDIISGKFYTQLNASPWTNFSDSITVSSTNKKGRVVCTREVPLDLGSANMIKARLDNFQGTLKISNLKIEIGNKATDWSPAPEDVQSQIDTHTTQITTTNNKVSEIKTDLNGITSRVGTVESKQTTTDGKVTGLESRMSNAESKITESAITNTVKKNFYTKSETDNQITSKGYQTQSQVQQTVDNLQLKFTQSGGYNLLKNSAFANNSFDKWWTWGTVTKWTNLTYYKEEGDMYIANSSTTDAGGLWQTIETPILPNTEYTLSVLVTKEGNVKGGCFAMEYQETMGGSHFTKQEINLTFDGKRHSYTFTTPNDSRIKYAKCGFRHDGSNSASGGYLIRINKPCLTTGRVNVWSPHPNEIYDGITTIDKDGIKVTASNTDTYTEMDASSFRVSDNNGGTVAEFAKSSTIPYLKSGTIEASNVYANNIPKKENYGDIHFIYVNGSTGNDTNDGSQGRPYKTVQRAIDDISDIQNTNVTIYVYNSVQGFTIHGFTGSGIITLSLQDSAVINGGVWLHGVTNRINITNESGSRKPTFKAGLAIDDCRCVDIYAVTFRGTNGHGTNIAIQNTNYCAVNNCDLGGLDTRLNCAIKVQSSLLWLFNCIGSNILDVVGLYPFSHVMMQRVGSSNVPDYSNVLLCNYDGSGRIQYWWGGTFTKTPSSGWNPAYTPTQKTQVWSFNKIWSDETLHGWSDRQELIQGYASTWNTGRWTGYMQFTDGMSAIRSAISGGTNLSGRIYVQRTSSSGNSTGSKLCLYASDGTLITNSTTINRSQGVWVSLSSAIIQKIQSGAITYFYLKADSNNNSTYFKCESNAKIEITYTN